MGRPLTDFQRKEAFTYLDGLRDSGTVIMNTSYTPTYLCDVFGHDYDTSQQLLNEWVGKIIHGPSPKSQEDPVHIHEHNVDGEKYTTISFKFAGTIEMLMALLHGMAKAEQEGNHD
jgi:hypothetical protein